MAEVARLKLSTDGSSVELSTTDELTADGSAQAHIIVSDSDALPFTIAGITKAQALELAAWLTTWAGPQANYG